jgi:hypothetical protein
MSPICAGQSSGSRVLVCGFDPRFKVLADSDARIYSRYFPNVETRFFDSVADLLTAVREYCGVIHLFCSLSPVGDFLNVSGATISGTRFIEECCKQGVKLLWVANGNPSDSYVKGFHAAGKPINLIMTLERHEGNFSQFLEELIRRVSSGQTMPVAWVSLAPQTKGQWQHALPECIFFAGNPSVKLLP